MYNKNAGINNFANQKQGGENVSKELFVRAEEVAGVLGISKPYAYKLIRQLNEELKAKGFLTIAGRVNRQYFNERFYGTERKDADASL